MTTALETQTPLELEFVRVLRQECIGAMDVMGDEAAARRLRLSEFGVQSLRSRSRWTLEQAVRIAIALGVVSENITRIASQHQS
jgi:hypothetical protein